MYKSQRQIFAENLVRFLDVRGIDQKDLAKKIGVSSQAVSSWATGIKYPRIDKIQKIADILNISKTRLMEDISAPKTNVFPDQGNVPVLGTICAGDGLLAEQNIEEYISYPFPHHRQPDFALRVKGDSMKGASIDNGDIVYMRVAPWAEHNGQIVAALIHDQEEGTLKRMKWSEGSNLIQLIPENSEYEAIEVMPNEVNVCGVYMGHFKPEREEKTI